MKSRSQHSQRSHVRTAARHAAMALVESFERRMLFSGGTLDPTFGTSGIASVSIGAGQEAEQQTAVAVQPDGKVLFATEDLSRGPGSRVSVERLLANGTPDPAFGTDGVVLVGFVDRIGYAGSEGGPIFLSVESDGDIVIGTDFIARLLPNGSPDTTFGNGTGIVTELSDVQGMAVQPDGKILVAAALFTAAQDPSYDPYDQVARLNADGSIDTTYGNDGFAGVPGLVTLSLNGTEPDVTIGGLAVDSAGRAVVGVSMDALDPDGIPHVTIGVVRLTTTGTVDLSFDGGYDVEPAAYDTAAESVGVVVAPTTGIIYQAANYGGVEPGYPTAGTLIAYSPDGQRPNAAPLPQAYLAGAGGLAMATNGAVLLAGYDFGRYVPLPAGDTYADVVEQFLPDTHSVLATGAAQQPDLTFGRNGAAIIDAADPGNIDFGLQGAVASAPNGSILFAGQSIVTEGAFAARLTGDEPAQQLVPFVGTVIGSPGSWDGKGNAIANAFDGNLGTFYDAADASGDWAGLDLGSYQTVLAIQYAPRAGYAARMVGGQFQGSDAPDFSVGVATLYTVTAAPPAGQLTTVDINPTGVAYRYYRYIGPAYGNCNVAEVRFLGAPLVGGPVGTAGSYKNQGNTLVNAFDGSLSTFYDGPDASGDWVGLDFSALTAMTQVSFAPRAGYAAAMVGGEIQAGDSPTFNQGLVTLYTITSAPAAGVLTTVALPYAGAFRYWRYLGPPNSNSEIAELEFAV